MEHHSNVIIGGGPAGINMALEFGKRGIEYLLLEANETVGGQWDRFPVCGQLISLNKRYVPGDSHTYRMRYDWHTLSTISADDVANDPLLRFTEWTSEHWPSSRIYKEYLKYVAERKGVSPHVRTHARVQRIARESGRFVLGISNAQGISADRVFCATGKSEPIVPDIKGLDSETCTFYGDFEPDTAAERYRNKVVIVLGRGNSAFEIAHHLVDITAETRVVTRSLPMFARQTHNVHDLRAQVSDVFDLMQLKSNNNIVSDRIVEVRRITGGRHEGRLLVRYETPCPHWSPPRWMKRTGIVDDVIVCCGFNYTLSGIFDMETVRPAIDEKGKYCLLTSTWESASVPGLYFLGAPMRINDPDAASGFVHGFRCNIQALGSIVAEKYHGMAVEPVFECDVPMAHPSDQLIHLSAFLVDLVSTSMPLFELFGYFGSTVTFTPGGDKGVVRARVWPAFPRAYNLERWGKEPTRLEIVFEYGFSRYGNGELPTHYFTLPADHFDTSRSAYVHPVFHVYQEGVEVDSFHMQESLIGRWDLDDYVDEETNLDQYKNVAFNACASALGLDERRSMLPVRDEFVDACYPLMSDDEVVEALRIQPTLALLTNRS
ncbi:MULTISPECIES: NAD(P)-binding domain-containing protein [unclassified Burkholderia]|uniref:NAD(P)-binding domain-containing protein n=1 Tax=unclassified Burkholderia TaxID=2613784 RepID=UPI0009ECB5DC|nr:MULTISPECIES: NAD(P)-binding domain-containing protein [unclassified Burkholderia]